MSCGHRVLQPMCTAVVSPICASGWNLELILKEGSGDSCETDRHTSGQMWGVWDVEI